MSSYLINKKAKNDSVVSIEELDGYKFKPKTKNGEYLKVSEVTIVDRVLIDKILTIKFNKSFNKVARLAIKVINDDDSTDDDAAIVLDEVELVRQILLNRYQKFLNQEKEKLFLKKLRLIENELRVKQIEIKRKAELLEQQEVKGRGR